MIRGIGIDIVDIAGFRAQLADSASAFADASFTGRERRASEARSAGDAAQHLAARWAAKEALMKAWSSAGLPAPAIRPHLDLREIEILNDAAGRPSVCLHGALAHQLDSRTRIHLSLSHDGGYAAAFVVIEAYP